MYPPFTMAGLDPATQQASVSERIDSADASALGGRVKPGHGEFLDEVEAV
jgi:hypothetical protein